MPILAYKRDFLLENKVVKLSFEKCKAIRMIKAFLKLFRGGLLSFLVVNSKKEPKVKRKLMTICGTQTTPDNTFVQTNSFS